MSMPIDKAKRVLKAYKEHNYVATEALPAVGYSSTTARKAAARTIDTAVKSLAQSGDKDVLKWLGMTEDDLAAEYGEIIKQNKNYPAKLRALEPLLKKKGIQWDNEKTTNAPTVNITMKAPVEKPLNKAVIPDSIENVAEDTLCDVTKDNKHDIITGGEDRFVAAAKKEEESQSHKIDQNLPLDKSNDVLPNTNDEIPASFTE